MSRSSHREHHEYIAIPPFWNFMCLFRAETGGGYRVSSPEMPGMVAFGDTLDEARANAQEELLVCLADEPLDDPFFDPLIEGSANTAG